MTLISKPAPSKPNRGLDPLVTLGLVYLVLMIVEVALIARFVRAGVAGVMPERFGAPDADADGGDDDTGDRDDVLAFAY